MSNTWNNLRLIWNSIFIIGLYFLSIIYKLLFLSSSIFSKIFNSVIKIGMGRIMRKIEWVVAEEEDEKERDRPLDGILSFCEPHN